MANNHNTEVLKTLSNGLHAVNSGTRTTHKFDVDYTEYDPRFKGRFIVHRPSAMEQMRMGVIKSQLLGGVLPVDMMTDNLATIISSLDVVIDEKPDWFNPYSEGLDYEILESVYLEYTEWYNSFRDKVRADRNKRDSGNTGSKDTMEDNGEVQSPTD